MEGNINNSMTTNIPNISKNDCNSFDLLEEKIREEATSTALTKKEVRKATNVTLQYTSENEIYSKVEIRSSLQDCAIDTVLVRLNYLLDESKKHKTNLKEGKLKGLIEIHKHLLLKPGTGSSDGLHVGFVDFDIAFELYILCTPGTLCGQRDTQRHSSSP